MLAKTRKKTLEAAGEALRTTLPKKAGLSPPNLRKFGRKDLPPAARLAGDRSSFPHTLSYHPLPQVWCRLCLLYLLPPGRCSNFPSLLVLRPVRRFSASCCSLSGHPSSAPTYIRIHIRRALRGARPLLVECEYIECEHSLFCGVFSRSKNRVLFPGFVSTKLGDSWMEK